jgi:predicted alpha/beta superfamily hydrolase
VAGRHAGPWYQGIVNALGGTEVHDVFSPEVGDTFRVFVGECGPDPAVTLVVADGNGLFGLAVDTVRLMRIPALVPPMRVVGVGYPDLIGIEESVAIRARDLAPTPSKHFPGAGGADAFLAFLRGGLREWVGDTETVYFGHSLAGQFGAYGLLSAPTAFDRWILSSPSLWWDHHRIFAQEAARAADSPDLPARAYLGIGSLETDAGRRAEAVALPDGHPAKPIRAPIDMVADAERFAAALASRGYPSLEFRLEIHPDEYHATAANIILTRALRHFYA